MKHLLLTTIAAVVLVGCGPSAPDISIHEAAKDGNIEAWLLDNSVQAGNIQVVKHNIANGADVNAKDESESTPLHSAALFGHKEIAELLIAKGADVNAKTKSGMTPLDKAIENDETETADLLRKHGGKTREELKAEGK